ncbi:hypothetical protein BGZ70_008031 [Mortierella alpina]|uniref:Uncharacterized protein n=1 Tax=Mortierella alpina TaxID=64518 RepID=A0A9P6J4L5_MORAP|nr:hypothetical protein BGZ70_008031 [Mortierella alpina]
MPGSGDRKQSVGSSGSRRKTTQSTTSTANASPELGSKPQTTEDYAAVNNFNSQDVVNHFDRTWKAALDSFHQPSNTNAPKPEMYKGAEAMAWGSKVAAKGSMSTGSDFLAELKRKQTTAS